MINKIRWLWKQFTGPIITAYCVGIFRLTMTIDSIIGYLNKLSVDTANDSHLTIISLFMGIPRPVITTFAEAYFWFTRSKEHPSLKGFSQLGDTSYGGQFTDLYDPRYTGTKSVAMEYLWRPILQATRDTDAEIGSVKWIDDMIAKMTLSTHTPYSYYRWWKLGETSTRAPGDFEIKMGMGDSYGDNYLYKREMLDLATNGRLNPERFVDFVFAIEGADVTIDIGNTLSFMYGAVPYLTYVNDNADTYLGEVVDTIAKDSATQYPLTEPWLGLNEILHKGSVYPKDTVNDIGTFNTVSAVIATWRTPLRTDGGTILGLQLYTGTIIRASADVNLETITVPNSLSLSGGALSGLSYFTPHLLYEDPTDKYTICYVQPDGGAITQAALLAAGGIELYFDAEYQCAYLRLIGDTRPIYKIYYIRQGG